MNEYNNSKLKEIELEVVLVRGELKKYCKRLYDDKSIRRKEVIEGLINSLDKSNNISKKQFNFIKKFLVNDNQKLMNRVNRFLLEEDIKVVEKSKRERWERYKNREMSEKEVDEYLETDEYWEWVKLEDNEIRKDRIDEIGKWLKKIQKDGLDIMELGSLKGLRKSLKDKGYISEKQLMWLIHRIEYDVRVQEMMIKGQLSRNKIKKRYECIVERN